MQFTYYTICYTIYILYNLLYNLLQLNRVVIYALHALVQLINYNSLGIGTVHWLYLRFLYYLLPMPR